MKHVASLIIIACLILPTIRTAAQNKNYTITVPNNATLEHKEKGENELTDVYTVHTDSTNQTMKYVMTVTALANSGATFDDVLSKNFEDGFLKTANAL